MSKNLLAESLYVSIGGQLIVTRDCSSQYILMYTSFHTVILLLEQSYPKGETQDDLYSTCLHCDRCLDLYVVLV